MKARRKIHRLHHDEGGRLYRSARRRSRMAKYTVDYGMRTFYPSIDTILWGRKIYHWVPDYYKKKGRKDGMFDTKLANYVFSRKRPTRTAPGVEFVSEPIKAVVRRLRATPGKHTWMVGGLLVRRTGGKPSRSGTASVT